MTSVAYNGHLLSNVHKMHLVKLIGSQNQTKIHEAEKGTDRGLGVLTRRERREEEVWERDYSQYIKYNI